MEKNRDYDHLIPAKFREEFEGGFIGKGTMMAAFRSRFDKSSRVLRAPHISESTLGGKDGGLSDHTKKEIEKFNVLLEHSYPYIVPVEIFQDYDGRGIQRTYSLQEYIDIKYCLVSALYRPSEELREQFKSHPGVLERFIDDTKKMILAKRLVPDLSGKHNLVLGHDGKIHLIDPNRITVFLPRQEWSAYNDEEWERNFRSWVWEDDVKKKINPAAFEVIGGIRQPFADMNIAALADLEARVNPGLKRAEDDLYKEILGRREIVNKIIMDKL